MDNSKLYELIDSADVGYYDLRRNEAIAIMTRTRGDTCQAVCDAYCYGFIKGQRAEKMRRAAK